MPQRFLRTAVAILLAAGLAACGGGDDQATPAATSTTEQRVSAEEVLAWLRTSSAPERAAAITGAEWQGGTLRIDTSLERKASNGPAGVGLCVGAQEKAGPVEVQIGSSDGGVIASTRAGLCGPRV